MKKEMKKEDSLEEKDNPDAHTAMAQAKSEVFSEGKVEMPSPSFILQKLGQEQSIPENEAEALFLSHPKINSPTVGVSHLRKSYFEGVEGKFDGFIPVHPGDEQVSSQNIVLSEQLNQSQSELDSSGRKPQSLIGNCGVDLSKHPQLSLFDASKDADKEGSEREEKKFVVEEIKEIQKKPKRLLLEENNALKIRNEELMMELLKFQERFTEIEEMLASHKIEDEEITRNQTEVKNSILALTINDPLKRRINFTPFTEKKAPKIELASAQPKRKLVFENDEKEDNKREAEVGLPPPVNEVRDSIPRKAKSYSVSRKSKPTIEDLEKRCKRQILRLKALAEYKESQLNEAYRFIYELLNKLTILGEDLQNPQQQLNRFSDSPIVKLIHK